MTTSWSFIRKSDVTHKKNRKNLIQNIHYEQKRPSLNSPELQLGVKDT
jgi:hypothetical protein